MLRILRPAGLERVLMLQTTKSPAQWARLGWISAQTCDDLLQQGHQGRLRQLLDVSQLAVGACDVVDDVQTVRLLTNSMRETVTHVVRQESPRLLRLDKSRLLRLFACMGLQASNYGEQSSQ